MYSFFRNLAIFGLIVAALNWLKERVCKSKTATCQNETTEQPSEAQAPDGN
jgi:hypothetical protein